MTDLTTPTTADDRRRRRAPAALLTLAERHAGTPAAGARVPPPTTLLPHEAVRLVELLAAGTARYAEGEPRVDGDDLLAALTLLPQVRAELDETELGLLAMARGRGLTWAEVAEGLGLRSAQAAQQRHERLAARVQDEG